jgi:hypothetical protein
MQDPAKQRKFEELLSGAAYQAAWRYALRLTGHPQVRKSRYQARPTLRSSIARAS